MTASKQALDIDILPESFAMCRLAANDAIPPWADGLPFCSISRSADELSIICPEASVPQNLNASRGWRALKLRGPFALDAVGILVQVAGPLAATGISMMAIATFDTDYVLVHGARLDDAIRALEQSGHRLFV